MSRINWTALDKVEDYWTLVEAAKKLSAEVGLSIAEWELANWKSRETD